MPGVEGREAGEDPAPVILGDNDGHRGLSVVAAGQSPQVAGQVPDGRTQLGVGQRTRRVSHSWARRAGADRRVEPVTE